MQRRPPKLIKPYVVSFARQVVGMNGIDLFYVPRRPITTAPFNDCFALIEAHVAQNGGTAVLGWAIWERPKIFIEAELHTVWHSPGGEYVDLAPRQKPIPRILFLRDPKRTYRGVQVDNMRRLLCSDKDVKRFLELAALRFELLNEGNMRHYHGPVHMTPEMKAAETELLALKLKMMRRYGPWHPEQPL